MGAAVSLAISLVGSPEQQAARVGGVSPLKFATTARGRVLSCLARPQPAGLVKFAREPRRIIS